MSRLPLVALWIAALWAPADAAQPAYTDQGIEMRVEPRSPEQVAPSFRGEGRLLSEAKLLRKEDAGLPQEAAPFEPHRLPPPKELSPREAAAPSKEGARSPSQNLEYAGQGLVMQVVPRTPEQTAAFYEARGFPRAAVEALSKACFITVGIQNRREDIVWLEPARWQFFDAAGQPIERLPRAYWEARFEKLGVPPANRATFGWTQLPEVRDLRPAEPVGGNVTLAPVRGTFTLVARFATGSDRRGPEIVVRFDKLTCPGR